MAEMRKPLYYLVFPNTEINVINSLNSVIGHESYLNDELIDISFLQEKKKSAKVLYDSFGFLGFIFFFLYYIVSDSS